MKIAICAQRNNEVSPVDTRFGRAGCFAIYDDQQDSWKFIMNEQDHQATQGAGLQAAQHILDAGVDVLLAENVGPKAMAVLQAEQIKVYLLPNNITAKEALQKYQENALEQISQANVSGHWQ